MSYPNPLRLLFGLEILALAMYFWQRTVSGFVGWGKNRLAFQILIFMLFLSLFTLALTRLLRVTAKYLQIKTCLTISDISRPIILSLSPVFLLCFIFLQYCVFLKDIGGYLLPISLAGVASLFFSFASRLKRTYPGAIPSFEFLDKWNPERFSLKRLSWLLFAISLGVYIVLATGLVFAPQPFTGDEPHYLLVTKSLVKDGDINLANNYINQDYLDFYPGPLRSHAYPGKKGGDFLYSKHLPALPVLLVPGYLIGEKIIRLDARRAEDPQFKRRIIVFFSRLPLSFLTALFGVMFFLLVFDITRRKIPSISAWAIFCFTTPIVFYSQLIYPEIPVALITIFILRNQVFKKENRASSMLIAGAGIALLPWFGLKYTVLSALLLGASIGVLWKFKRNPESSKRIIHTLIPIIVSAALYFFYFWSLYGNFSPVSVYKGISTDVPSQSGLASVMRTDFVEFLKRAFGYFLDQRVGIFIYSPIFILGIAGFFFFFKKKRVESLVLLIVFSVYGVFSAYYYWGGFCPPGRPLIPVLCILALLFAISLNEKRTRIRDVIIRASTALSFFVVWAALKDPWILYNEDISSDYAGKAIGSNLLSAISNTFIDFQKWIPSFFRGEKLNPMLLIFWTIFIILIVAIFVCSGKERRVQDISLKLGKQTAFVVFLSLVVLVYLFFDIRLERKAAYEDPSYALYFQDDNNFGKELEGFWTKGERRTSVILASDQPVEVIRVSLLGLTDGTATIQVGPSVKKISRNKKNGLRRKLSFPAPVGFRLGKDYLYTITIRDSSGFYPNGLDKSSNDNRYLGVFVKIAR